MLIDGVGGTVEQQARAIAPGDAVLAVSFAPYAPETVGVVRDASDRGVPIVAITDAPLSPLVPVASVCFEVEDAAVTGFRSLTATMCLAVSLVVALGQHAETRGRRVRAARGTPAARRRATG